MAGASIGRIVLLQGYSELAPTGVVRNAVSASAYLAWPASLRRRAPQDLTRFTKSTSNGPGDPRWFLRRPFVPDFDEAVATDYLSGNEVIRSDASPRAFKEYRSQ